MAPVEILILGAGWTSQFLIPLLKTSSISYSATTTTGHISYGNRTLPFRYDPTSFDSAPYSALPSAKTVLITFPLKGPHQSKQLVSLYRQAHGADNRWIQLGSTGIFTDPQWNDHNSSYDKEDPRAVAEDELLGLGGVVLNLAGLYGGERNPRNWVVRVARTKAEVKAKKVVHLIHGQDVARGIIAVHGHFTPGKRWLLTDLRVNDWWDLIQTWGPEVEANNANANANGNAKEGEESPPEYTRWVGELLVEEGIKSLPRSVETLGRVLDSRAFWSEVGIWPVMGRVP